MSRIVIEKEEDVCLDFSELPSSINAIINLAEVGYKGYQVDMYPEISFSNEYSHLKDIREKYKKLLIASKARLALKKIQNKEYAAWVFYCLALMTKMENNENFDASDYSLAAFYLSSEAIESQSSITSNYVRAKSMLLCTDIFFDNIEIMFVASGEIDQLDQDTENLYFQGMVTYDIYTLKKSSYRTEWINIRIRELEKVAQMNNKSVAELATIGKEIITKMNAFFYK